MELLARPDTLPVLLLVPLLVVLLVLWWRLARVQDRELERGGEEAVLRRQQGAGEGEDPRPHAWPYLVRMELLAALVVLLVLTVWSILVDAPLQQVADLATTPNPSKAPWYFVGLQELLVYFDPWISGVTLPTLALVGLCLVPYLDVNPDGNGFYCWRPRRFAIACFLFGFLVLWILPILVGTFCRGPGWRWFWPWEPWQRFLPVGEATVDWPQLFGITSAGGAMAFGGATLLVYYGLALVYWLRRRATPTLQRLGRLRFAIVAFLLLTMMGVPIKVVLRLALSVKYIWVTPWFSV